MIHWLKTKDKRVLYNPIIGYRREAEWDDHAETYPWTFEGPDLWITVELPKGMQKVSLYFVNPNGHTTTTRFRDYLVEIREYTDDLEKAHLMPVLAHARVSNFWGGVYKSFLVKGGETYLIRVNKNYSLNTLACGIMIDNAKDNIDTKALCGMGNVIYRPPEYGGIESDSDMIKTADNVWRMLDDSYDKRWSPLLDRQCRVLAYRTAMNYNARNGMLDNWRWKLNIWTQADRQEFTAKMGKAWQWIIAHNSHMFEKNKSKGGIMVVNTSP